MSMPPPGPPPPPPPPGSPPPAYVNTPVPGYPPGSTHGFPSASPGMPGQLAGFWVRLGAWVLDGILYGLVAAPFIGVGVFLAVDAFSDCESIGDELVCPPGSPSAGSLLAGIAIGLAGLVLAFVLYVRAMARTGQPWGARIAGVRVVRSDSGAPIGTGRALGRTLFAAFLSGQICYLGYLWAIWDGRKQTWHDKVTDAVVIRV